MRKPDLELPKHGGVQRIYRFPNGYGASVIRHSFSYGIEENLWELAVLNNVSENLTKWNLCYETPITDDVIGHLTDRKVDALLKKIEKLKVKP